ncbi:hypothetical protein ONZ45_g8172 [Pleurotus djamor]|nr:hypothetical protein ONZ45_g8172 [Pleurotus djamor]
MASLLDYLVASGYLQYYSIQYAQLSSLSFLAWDYAITFSDKFEFFRSGHWKNPARILFFIVGPILSARTTTTDYHNRIGINHSHGKYFTPSESFSLEEHMICTRSLWYDLQVPFLTLSAPSSPTQLYVLPFQQISALSIMFPLNLILSLRIYALYGRPRWIAILLGTMLAASVAVQIYVVARFSPEFKFIHLPESNIMSCDPTSTQKIYLALIPAIAFDVPALMLVLLRRTSYRVLRGEDKCIHVPSLFRMMVRDSVIYFIIIIFVYIALAISWVMLPGVESFITYGYGISMASVADAQKTWLGRREVDDRARKVWEALEATRRTPLSYQEPLPRGSLEIPKFERFLVKYLIDDIDPAAQQAQMEQAIRKLTSAARDYSLVEYAQVSSFTFFIWDYFVTLPNESRYFWSGQWTYARVLFYLNRYQTMAWMIFNIAAAFVPYKSEKLILACRVYGLYRRDRRIAALLVALLTTNLITQIYLLLHFASDNPREMLPWKPGVYTCMGSHGQPRGLFLSIIPSLVFDTAALSLVVLQGLTHIRSSKRVGLRSVGFMHQIMKDSVLHFIVILLVYVAIELAWFKLPNVQTYFVYSFGIPIISVAGTRILISLKRQSDVSRRIMNDSMYLFSSSALR